MRKTDLFVGIFVVVGVAAIAFLAIRIGGGALLGNHTYRLQARFADVGGLNVGANVEIAGVRVGTVRAITLNKEHYDALIDMEIDAKYPLDDDSMASIRTKGIIGDKYVGILPGGSGIALQPGRDVIVDTEPAVDVEGLIKELIGKVAFGSIDDNGEPSETKKDEAFDPDPLSP